MEQERQEKEEAQRRKEEREYAALMDESKMQSNQNRGMTAREFEESFL